MQMCAPSTAPIVRLARQADGSSSVSRNRSTAVDFHLELTRVGAVISTENDSCESSPKRSAARGTGVIHMGLLNIIRRMALRVRSHGGPACLATPSKKYRNAGTIEPRLGAAQIMFEFLWHYQPKTATFERRSIPPAFVRRISRPMAERNTAGSCKRRRYSRPQGLGHRPSLACASRRLACDDPLRPAKADLVEVEIRQMRADVVEHARDGAADPIVEAFRRVDVNRTAGILTSLMVDGVMGRKRTAQRHKAFHSSLIRCAFGSTASVRTRSASNSDRSSITAARTSPAAHQRLHPAAAARPQAPVFSRS